MDNLKVRNSNGVYPGTPITVEEKQKRLYHYTSFESFVKIWLSQSLLFSKTDKVNDILEKNKALSTYNVQKDIFDAYQEEITKYKQISLVMDYDSYITGAMSPMMWGHYGNNGDGVCIELDPAKLNLENIIAKPIEYCGFIPCAPPLPGTLHKENITEYVSNKLDVLFFCKSIDWQGENEYRLVKRLEECSTEDKLDISEAITAIYVTSAFSSTCKFVEKLVGDIPVKFFHFNTVENCRIPRMTLTKKYRESFKPQEGLLKIPAPDLSQYTIRDDIKLTDLI